MLCDIWRLYSTRTDLNESSCSDQEQVWNLNASNTCGGCMGEQVARCETISSWDRQQKEYFYKLFVVKKTQVLATNTLCFIERKIRNVIWNGNPICIRHFKDLCKFFLGHRSSRRQCIMLCITVFIWSRCRHAGIHSIRSNPIGKYTTKWYV